MLLLGWAGRRRCLLAVCYVQGWGCRSQRSSQVACLRPLLSLHLAPICPVPLLQVPFLHRSNPVFDERLEVIVDGATALQRDLLVHIDIWVQHWILRDTFKVGGSAGGW